MPTEKQKVRSFSCAAKSLSPQENIWFALRATKEKRALSRSISPKNRYLVEFYDLARTHFEREV